MKRKNDFAIIRLVVATGISSVVTQLVTIREFLVQFQGNEFVIALILFNWLILSGIGTLMCRFVTKRLNRPTINCLASLSLLLAALSALQILAIRFLRDLFFIHGSSVGFYPTLTFISLTITPYSILLGFVLPYSLFVLRVDNPDYPGARIYITDNLGDVTGGALFSFVLVFLVTPLKAIFLAGLPLIGTAYLLFPPFHRFRPAVLLPSGLAFLILLSGVFLEPRSLSHPEGKLVYYRESRYGRIAVYQDREQFTLFENGTPRFSSQNLILAEETIHYPLSQIAQPKHILLISAEGGMMAELQKYKPEAVDYLELDPEVTDIQFKFGLIKKFPGLHVINQDGRAYLSGIDKLYDAIIVNLPEPGTFQVNRFFTDQFFALIKRHLTAGGIFSFSLEGFENYLAEPQRLKLSSLYNTVAGHFAQVLLLPGQKIFFLCSDHSLNADIPVLLAQKGILTSYISNFFYGNLTEERIKRLNQLVDPAAPKNTDNYPQLMRLMFSQWFAKFSTSPVPFFAVLTVLGLIYLVRITPEEFLLFSTGWITMGGEILVIFAFQIFFGYIYLQIGLIVTVFLAGLLPGAWFGDRLRGRGKQVLILTDALLVVLMGIFILAFELGDRLPPAFFLVFGFMVSLACGFQFPVALYFRGGDNPAVVRSFSADLIGAACGTLTTSVVLIPYLGLIWAAAGLIGLKFISLIVMGISHEKNKQTTISLL